MRTQEFDFDTTLNVLPRDPLELRGRKRDGGRMIVLNRSKSTIEHAMFTDICGFLQPGDLLVLNDSYVLPNTAWFHCNGESTQLSVCGHEPDGTTIVEIISKSLPVKPDLVLVSNDNNSLSCKVIESVPYRLWKVKFQPPELLTPVLDQFGKRIHLNQTHWEKTPGAYRSIYAKAPGSLEIPSAGLHFTHEMLSKAAAKQVEMAYITLHVGATEIVAVRHISAKEIENHKVRSEYFEVGGHAVALINKARAEGRRVVAIGTTVMRTLESLARNKTKETILEAQTGWTDLYIYPGFDFKVVNVLLTNLHRPRSSHIVLTAAFAGKDFVMRSYDEITKDGGYEFDMFGDSMLIV